MEKCSNHDRLPPLPHSSSLDSGSVLNSALSSVPVSQEYIVLLLRRSLTPRGMSSLSAEHVALLNETKRYLGAQCYEALLQLAREQREELRQLPSDTRNEFLEQELNHLRHEDALVERILMSMSKLPALTEPQSYIAGKEVFSTFNESSDDSTEQDGLSISMAQLNSDDLGVSQCETIGSTTEDARSSDSWNPLRPLRVSDSVFSIPAVQKLLSDSHIPAPVTRAIQASEEEREGLISHIRKLEHILFEMVPALRVTQTSENVSGIAQALGMPPDATIGSVTRAVQDIAAFCEQRDTNNDLVEQATAQIQQLNERVGVLQMACRDKDQTLARLPEVGDELHELRIELSGVRSRIEGLNQEMGYLLASTMRQVMVRLGSLRPVTPPKYPRTRSPSSAEVNTSPTLSSLAQKSNDSPLRRSELEPQRPRIVQKPPSPSAMRASVAEVEDRAQHLSLAMSSANLNIPSVETSPQKSQGPGIMPNDRQPLPVRLFVSVVLSMPDDHFTPQSKIDALLPRSQLTVRQDGILVTSPGDTRLFQCDSTDESLPGRRSLIRIATHLVPMIIEAAQTGGEKPLTVFLYGASDTARYSALLPQQHDGPATFFEILADTFLARSAGSESPDSCGFISVASGPDSLIDCVVAYQNPNDNPPQIPNLWSDASRVEVKSVLDVRRVILRLQSVIQPKQGQLCRENVVVSIEAVTGGRLTFVLMADSNAVRQSANSQAIASRRSQTAILDTLTALATNSAANMNQNAVPRALMPSWRNSQLSQLLRPTLGRGNISFILFTSKQSASGREASLALAEQLWLKANPPF